MLEIKLYKMSINKANRKINNWISKLINLNREIIAQIRLSNKNVKIINNSKIQCKK